MQRSAFTLICCLGLAVIRASAQDAPVPTVVDVADDQELRQAFAQAKPGTTIRIAPGTYAGGVSAREWRGVADRPIIMKAADPKRPPLIQGGTGIHIAGASYVEIRDLIIVGSTGNGINIDDGGKTDSSSHLTLVGLTVGDSGP